MSEKYLNDFLGRMKGAVKELMGVILDPDTYNPIKTYRDLSLLYETAKPYETGWNISGLKKYFSKNIS